MGGGFQEQLIGFAHSVTWADVSAEARRVLQLSLLDWAACGLAGQNEPVSVAVREFVSAEAGTGQAFVFGEQEQRPARAAALANGATSHALDYDDTHFLHIGHPSVVIFSAALAVSQQVGASGRGFLESALVGFETSCRIGQWLGRAHYEAGFHMTATAGCFGAALAAARLLGANPSQMAAALGLASTRASGLKAQFGSMGKPYNAGLAAANGVEAAQLAMRGMTSDMHGLDSFAAGHAGVRDVAAADRLGQAFVTEGIIHKFHACCHGTHAALEVLAQLKVEAREVTGVLIEVHPRWLKVCNQPAPTTGLEAKFSYRMCAALALAGLDTGALETFSAAHCADLELQALRDLVTVRGDASLADGAAKVSVSCHDDMARQAAYDLDQPMAIKDREVRVRKKAVGLIGDVNTDNLWIQINKLPDTENTASLLAATS